MRRPHQHTELRFTLTEAAEVGSVEYQALNQWLARRMIQIGGTPPGMRRTLYSIADVLTIALISDLSKVIAMRPGIATAFIDKAQARLSQVARDGFGDNPHYLLGFQSGPDTFSVLPMIKVRTVDWAEFDHPVAVVPIDAIIRRIIERANKKFAEDNAPDNVINIVEGKGWIGRRA